MFSPAPGGYSSPLKSFFQQADPEQAELNPRIVAAISLTRYGVLAIVGGLIFGAVTKFRSGWGLSVAGAGLCMILLAWTIQELWWLGLLTVAGYFGYKLWNHFNPNVKTEGILE